MSSSSPFPLPSFSFKVTEHNVLFPDEYDEIERSLGPYRAFTTEDLAQRIKKSEELRETVKIRVYGGGQTQVVVSVYLLLLSPTRPNTNKAHVFFGGVVSTLPACQPTTTGRIGGRTRRRIC